VVGLVSLEDVIEELIGEFDDESDRRFGDCLRLPDGSFAMSGTTRRDDFEACTSVALPPGEFQTVAGYVIEVADGIPSVGDVVSTPLGTFEVTEMDGYAIDQLIVVLSETALEMQRSSEGHAGESAPGSDAASSTSS
jgi:CBS domain containing-hemolysin-like protein